MFYFLLWCIQGCLATQSLLDQSYIENAGFQIDKVTGELLKPKSMSNEQFSLIKMLRLQEVVQSVGQDDYVDSPLYKSELGTIIQQGFFKQENLLVEKLEKIVEKSIQGIPSTRVLKIGDYVENNVVSKIGFSIDGDSIKVYQLDNGTSTELQADSEKSSFDNFINFQGLDTAKISDVVISKNPTGLFNYVCVAIDYAPDYPPDNVPPMDINNAIPMPDAGKSILFRFVLTNGKYAVIRNSLLDTVKAQDAEFWTYDNKLFLAIAELGSIQTWNKYSPPTIYVQEDPELDSFTSLELKGQDEISGGPLSVTHFYMLDQSFLVFANSKSTRSPIFSYNPETGSYDLWQNLLTLGDQAVTALTIKDSYPINSNSFLIFSSSRAIDSAYPVGTEVFKYVHDGWFVPYQTLVTNGRTLAVKAFVELDLSVPRTTDDGSGLVQYTNRRLKHAVVLLHVVNGLVKLVIYQYDGIKFEEAMSTTFSTSQSAELIKLGKLEYIDLSLETASHMPVLLINSPAGTIMYEFIFASEISFYQETDKKLDFCLNELEHRRKTRNFRELRNIFSHAPRSSVALQKGLQVEDVVIGYNSTLTIEEIKLSPSTESAYKVELITENLQTISDHYIDKVVELNERMENLTAASESTMLSLASDSIARTDKTNVFTGPLHLKNVQGTELKGIRLSGMNDLKNTHGVSINIEQLKQNMVVIDGLTRIELGYTQMLFGSITMDSIVINNEYEIQELEGHSPADYVVSDGRSQKIRGELIFKEGATFIKDVTTNVVHSTDSSDHLLTRQNVLLRNGDQTFNDSVNFKVRVEVDNLETNYYNGVDMSIMSNAVQITDKLILKSSITVNSLVLNGNLHAKIGVLDEQLNLQEVVDFASMLAFGMRKNKKNNVLLLHHYTTVNASVDTKDLVNDREWPLAFVNKQIDLIHPGEVVFDDLVFSSGSMLEISSFMSSGGNSISIIDGKPDVLLVSDVYGNNLVNATKHFTSIDLESNSTVSGRVLGFNMTVMKDLVEEGESSFDNRITINKATLNGDVIIKTLKTSDGIIYTSCSDDCINNNLQSLYKSGVRRRAETLSAFNIHLDEAVFKENVNVSSINNLNPDEDLVLLDGNSMRTLNNITFTSGIQVDKNLNQFANGKIMVCDRNVDHKPLCKSENGCCSEDENQVCQCYLSGSDCLIKDNVKNIDLCKDILSEDVKYIAQNSLNPHGLTTLNKSIVFHGGLTANNMNIGETCSLNNINCHRIATVNHNETFTGENSFIGSVIARDTIFIQDKIEVGKKIGSVSIDTLYSDSVFLAVEDQVIANARFSKRFTVQNISSNGVDIGSTPATDLTNMVNFVLNEESDVHLNSEVKFMKNVTTQRLEGITWNGVDLNNFFTNLWTNKLQTIRGDIHITENAIIKGSLKGDTSVATINCIDISDLSSKAVKLRSEDHLNLTHAIFTTLYSMHDPRGLYVKDFLGVNVPEDIILKRNSLPIEITGKKTFDKTLKVKGNTDLNNVDWIDSGFSVSIPSDKLFSFMDDEELDKVVFSSSLDIETEPTFTPESLLNGVNFAEFYDSVWKTDDEINVDFDISADEFEFLHLKMESSNALINGIDINYWNQNYLSLTLNQTEIVKNVTFKAGLILDRLNVHRIMLEDLSSELEIRTPSTQFKIRELNNSVLHKNGLYNDIKPRLQFANIETDNLTMTIGSKVCDRDVCADLSDDPLIYNTNMKYIHNNLKLDGDLHVEEELITNVLELSTDLEYEEQYKGIHLSNRSLTVNLDELYDDAVYINSAVEFEGLKNFSELTKITRMDAHSSVDEMDIGRCESPLVLLKRPCNGNSPQVISGVWSFEGNLELDALSVLTKTINDVNLDQYFITMVLKSDNMSITGVKSYVEGLEFSSTPDFDDSVFGVQMNKLVDQTIRTANMNYQSGAVTPNLEDSLEVVKHAAEDIPQELQYVSLMEWTVDHAGRMVSLISSRDANPLKLAGLQSGLASTDVTLGFYALSDLNPISSKVSNSFEIPLNPLLSLDLVDIVSIPLSDTLRLLVASNIETPRLSSDSFNIIGANESKPFGSLQTFLVDVNTSTSTGVQASTTELIYDLAPLRLGDFDCVLVCQGENGAHVQCMLGTDNNLFTRVQDITEHSCYKVSTDQSHLSNDHVTEVYAAIQTNPQYSKGVILKISKNYDYSSLQEITLRDSTRMDLVRFSEDISSFNVFLSLMSPFEKNVHVSSLNNFNQKFEEYTELSVDSPMDSRFLVKNNELSLFVLDGTSFKATIKSYRYGGLLKFVERPSESLAVRGVVSIEPVWDDGSESLYLLTTGTRDQDNLIFNIEPSSVFKYIYKEDDVSALRQKFKHEAAFQKGHYSMECQKMIINYLTALHHDGIINVTKAGELFLKTMPLNYISYKIEDFEPTIRQQLESIEFLKLDGLKTKAAAAANLYLYTGVDRVVSDTSYAGTHFIYQEDENILYTSTRLMSKSVIKRAVSYWTSCEGGDKLSVNSVNSSVYQDSNDLHTIHQCNIVDTLPNQLQTLEQLDNKDVAGAVVIHTTDDELSPKYACGYIKNPTRVELQLFKDHDQKSLHFNPFQNP